MRSFLSFEGLPGERLIEMKGAAARSKRQMSPVVDLIEFGVVLVFV